MQVALRMTVVIGSFVKRFKAVLYERTWSFSLLKWNALKQLLFLILLLTLERTLNSTKDAISRALRLHIIACFHEENKCFRVWWQHLFGENGLTITIVKGNKKLIERYEISLANYRGDSFNFYRQNVSPIVGHKP